MRDATVEIIAEIKPHPNADRLDLAMIRGFQCVVQKGLYKGGEVIIYIRPDSVLPMEDWAEGYRKYSPKRIKPVQLREQWSEGIIVPFEILPENIREQLVGVTISAGYDVTELLGVRHYEEPLPQEPGAIGGLKYFMPETHEKRIEEYTMEQIVKIFDEPSDLWLKVDGRSTSYGYKLDEDYFFITGRSLEFKHEALNSYTENVDKYDLKNKLIAFCKKHNKSICLRGEGYGGKIQAESPSPYQQSPRGWALFSVYLIDERRYARKGDPFYFKNVAEELDLPIVQLIEENVNITPDLIEKYSTGITKLNGKPFEGVVVQHPKGSFKILNKHYDSKK